MDQDLANITDPGTIDTKHYKVVSVKADDILFSVRYQK